MPITASATTIYPKSKGVPSRTSAASVAIRNCSIARELEPAAKEFEKLSLQIDAIVQALATIAPQITVNATGFSGTITVRNAAGTGTSAITVVDGQITAYAP